MCVVMNHIASMIKKKLSYFKQLNDVCLYLCSSFMIAIIITLFLEVSKVFPSHPFLSFAQSRIALHRQRVTHKKTRAKFWQTMKNTLDYTVKRFQIYLMYVIMGQV